MTEREIEQHLRHYEGLICKTAHMLVTGEHPALHGRPGVEQELEDIEQLIRIKVWRAIERFDETKVVKKARKNGRTPMDSYVFMCTFDVARDIAKKRRRGELHIDDIAPSKTNAGAGAEFASGPRDRFDERYLSQDHEETYGDAEDEPPNLPNTLSERERQVIVYLYREYKQTEIAVELGITKREVESAVRSIRTKLGERRPNNDQATTSSKVTA